MENINPDLTSFASLLGNSFASKINLLSQILQNAHYPSVGKYKENLLLKIIKEYIPKKYDVGTGFVLFVHDATEERKLKKGFDKLNMGSYSASKQCDIIIYDSSTIPLIFKDDDFIIVRPESVKSIIEVKSKANKKEIDSILNSFYDFSLKWQKSSIFYKEHNHDIKLKKPKLFAMCWDVSKNKKGNATISGNKIREQIANFYENNVDKDNLIGFPVLDDLFCYNEFIVSLSVDKKDDKILMGWSTIIGKFIRYNNDEMFYDGDSTISKLLASIHWALDDNNFNRFYSYHDENRENDFQGFSKWLEKSEHMKALNSENFS